MKTTDCTISESEFYASKGLESTKFYRRIALTKMCGGFQNIWSAPPRTEISLYQNIGGALDLFVREVQIVNKKLHSMDESKRSYLRWS